jgi:cobalt-zinc-cadmium efflux system outer membrane protein
MLLLTTLGCGAASQAYAPSSAPGVSLSEPPARRVDVFVPNVTPPNPATTSEVTLEQLLRYADQRAPSVRVARARARRGDAEVEAASPLLQANPEVEVGLGSRTVAAGTHLETEVSVQQSIEIAGERGLRIETAERLREVALSQQDEARWQVHGQVHALFLQVLVAQQRAAAVEQVVRFAAELEQIAQRRVDAGDDAPLSMLVAHADLAQARELLIAAQQIERAAHTRLAEVSGWPVGRPLQPRGELPPVRLAGALSHLVRLAADHHPSLRTRALSVAQAESRVRLEEREAWPEPTVGLAYAREGEPSDAPDVWLVTLGVPMPLWNRNQGGRARASVALDTARTQQETLGQRLHIQLERAASALDAAAERVRIYGDDIMPAMRRNLDLIREAYDVGEIDIHAVSQTRERVLATQERAIAARAEYYQALVNLEVLVGTELDDAALQETTP